MDGGNLAPPYTGLYLWNYGSLGIFGGTGFPLPSFLFLASAQGSADLTSLASRTSGQFRV